MGFSLTPDWSFILTILQTAAVIAAVFYAWYAVREHRAIARQNNTIAILLNELDTGHLNNQGMQILREVDECNHDDIAIYANLAIDDEKKCKSIKIRDLLNYYEYLSIAVSCGIYDLNMLKQAQKTSITKVFERAKPFIDRARKVETNPNLYIEFERFVSKLSS